MEKGESAGQWEICSSPNLGYHHKSAADSSVDLHLKNTALFSWEGSKSVPWKQFTISPKQLHHLSFSCVCKRQTQILEKKKQY